MGILCWSDLTQQAKIVTDPLKSEQLPVIVYSMCRLSSDAFECNCSRLRGSGWITRKVSYLAASP